MSEDERTILFFDGVCNLCNGFIDFLIRRDTKRSILYASLQGDEANRLVPEHAKALSSVVLYKNRKVYTESTAAILTLAELGGVWVVFKFLLVFPDFLRNPSYKLVAKNRYKWFGKREVCRVPTPEERRQFLD